jgi:hypothetical protein
MGPTRPSVLVQWAVAGAEARGLEVGRNPLSDSVRRAAGGRSPEPATRRRIGAELSDWSELNPSCELHATVLAAVCVLIIE